MELYTSEGCSSCPPADRALMVLEQQQPVHGAKIIALELHVDYWDNESWKDPFSSALYSQRQNLYAQKFRSSQVYTPQMVVDGEKEFVGSDAGRANLAIAQAAKAAKANVALSREEEKLKIKIDGLPKTDGATVFLALAEDNLDTDIRGGENSGKKLVHSSVVRELRSIGTIDPENAAFETETGLQPDKSWKKQDLKVIVFVQENKSRKVLGVGQIGLGIEK